MRAESCTAFLPASQICHLPSLSLTKSVALERQPGTVYPESPTLVHLTLPAKAAIPHPAIAAISSEISAL